MLGRIDEALEHLTRAIELAPRDAAALASRGDLLTDMGEYEAAAHDYEQAIAINPKFADAYRGSAWLLATCPDGAVRNPGVALERAQKAVELERKADATTFDTLAAAQASVGDFQAATRNDPSRDRTRAALGAERLSRPDATLPAVEAVSDRADLVGSAGGLRAVTIAARAPAWLRAERKNIVGGKY